MDTAAIARRIETHDEVQRILHQRCETCNQPSSLSPICKECREAGEQARRDEPRSQASFTKVGE
jgi:hypothetical protein